MSTCAQLVRKAGTLVPRLPAVHFGDHTQTYAELFRRACQLVNLLHDLGINQHDRVALLSVNTARTVEEIAGLALGGFVRVPLHFGNTVENHLNMLSDSGAAVLIADAESAAIIREQKHRLPELRLIITDDPSDEFCYETLLRQSSPLDGNWPVSPDDVIQIGYTGGTTGPSKGTVQTQSSWFDVAVENLAILPEIDSDDVYLAASALTAVGGAFVFPALARYIPIVVMPVFDAAEALQLIERHRATLTAMLPGMALALAEEARLVDRDVTSLRVVFVASTTMSERAIRAVTDALGDVLVFGYGQSESAPVTMLTSHDIRRALASNAKHLQSVGRPLPRATVQIIDPAGRMLGTGSVGEVVVSSAGTMREYWRDSEQTRAKFTPDGMVRTGDLGSIDDDGYLYLFGRADDVIVSSTLTAYPTVIENAIGRNPSVKEVAVVGLRGDSGERPAAVLYLHPNADSNEVLEWCRNELAEYGMARVRVSTEPLPKTPAGKILRRVVKQQEAVVAGV